MTGGHATGGCCDANQKPRSHDTSRIAWAKPTARVGEEFPLECPACGGDIRLNACITEPGPIRKILTHLGEPFEPPPVSPACLGVAMAKTSGRTWPVTGDGSHQLTLNELAVMGRYGFKPRIFVLNNGLYGVEDVLSERGHPYDDLAQVNYHLLPVAFGCKGQIVAKVGTNAEFDAVLTKIASEDAAAYVEVMIPNEESRPMPEAVVDLGYKLRTPPVG